MQGSWIVKPVRPRGPASEYDDYGPRTTHATVAQWWAEARFGKPRAGESLKFVVVSPDGTEREFVSYRVVEVAPVVDLNAEPTLAERHAAEMRASVG